MIYNKISLNIKGEVHMEEQKEIQMNKMGTMPVGRLLMNMAWPAILSMTISALYNIVDSIFVAKISEDALTAVSIVNPVQMLIIALAVGSGVGINSLIARRLGAQNQVEADKAASTSIRIGLFNYIVFLLVGLFITGIFVSGYAQKGSPIYNQACIYMTIVCVGSLFLNVQIILEKVLQATGNMIAPMICGLSGAIVNIVLDPILIFGLFGMPRLEVAGAAIATISGQMVGMSIAVLIVIKGEHLVEIKLRKFKIDWNVVKDIYKVGFPSIIMQSLASFLIVFYNMILVAYSTTAVAVLGIYFKVQSFVFMPVFGLNQGSMPIMGYNYGARDKKRLLDTYKYAFNVALIVMSIGFILFQVFPTQILLMFNASKGMLEIGVPALRLISICFPFAAYGIITGTVFQATGNGLYSLIVSVMRQFVGILPLAYILIRIGGVTLSWMAFPLAEIIGVGMSVVMFKRLYDKDLKNM